MNHIFWRFTHIFVEFLNFVGFSNCIAHRHRIFFSSVICQCFESFTLILLCEGWIEGSSTISDLSIWFFKFSLDFFCFSSSFAIEHQFDVLFGEKMNFKFWTLFEVFQVTFSVSVWGTQRVPDKIHDIPTIENEQSLFETSLLNDNYTQNVKLTVTLTIEYK